MENSKDVLPKANELQAEKRNVMRFLITHGFNQGSPLSIQDISFLIAKNSEGLITHIMTEFALLAKHGERPQTKRANLDYCASMNCKSLRDSIKHTYDYDIGNYYGIKAFINQISLVYSVYAKTE